MKCDVVREGGIMAAIEQGYLFDEGDDDRPTGLAECPQEEIEAFLQSLRGPQNEVV